MSRSSLLIATSFFVLAACQPASEPTENLVAETPPTVAEDVVEEVTEDAVAVETESSDHDDDHDEHEEDHDEHDEEHVDDHADEHSDHDDDHAGGEAHVHGLSDLAVNLEDNRVSISIDGALANFDLDGSQRTLDDITPYIDNAVELIGGECQRDEGRVSIRPIGDHGNLTIDLYYSCAAIDQLEALNVTAFEAFSGFEDVNAVILTETGQTASALTASDPRLDLR